MKVTQEFYGDEFLLRLQRAAGRAVVGMGVAVAVETKQVTHVQFGTLRRSVHAAPSNAIHDDDEATAKNADMLRLDVEPDEGAWGPQIEVGSWLEYACAEWVGRSHPGIQQGLENARSGGRFHLIAKTAFEEEGLGDFRL